jgi:hypothetical protein
MMTRLIGIITCLVLPACAGLNNFVMGDPKDKVTLENDKFTGKNALKGVVYADKDSGLTVREQLSVTWEPGSDAVVVSFFRHDRNSNILPLLQSIGFDIAADDRPVAHSEPRHEGKVLDIYWSELTVSVAVSTADFRHLAASKSVESRVCGTERQLSDYELSVVREFVRRMAELQAPPPRA